MNAEKKMFAVLAVFIMLVGVLALSGCAPMYSQKQVDAKLSQAHNTAAIAQAELQSQLDDATEQCSIDKAKLQADMDSVTAELRSVEADKDALAQSSIEEKTALEDRIVELEAQLTDLQEQYTTASDACQKVEDYDFNSAVADVLTDNDLTQLQDTKVEFDGEDYDVHEELSLSSDVEIVTSQEGDEEFADKPYLVVGDDGAVIYSYVFDDSVDVTKISDDETLKIKFLGEDWEIKEADSDSITLVRGEKHLLQEGDSVSVAFDEGVAEVKAVVISDSADEVKFSVNGELSHALGVGDSDEVGGYYVYVSEVLPNEAGETAGGDMAEFRIYNDETELEIKTGDWVDDDVKLWKYEVEVDGDDLKSISVSNDEKYYKVDDDTPAIALGERFSLPKDFVSFGISELSDTTYDTVKFSFDDSYGDADEPVLMIEAGEGSLSVGTEEVDEVGFNGSAYIYRDDEGEWQSVSSVTYENDDYEVTPAYSAGVFTFDEVSMTVDIAGSKLGATEEEVDALDVVLNGMDVSSREYDILSSKGVVVKGVEDNTEDDRVVLEVPSDDVEAKLCFM